MSDERIIIDKDDYHEILNKIKTAKRLVDANDMIGVEGGIISIEDILLNKVKDPGDEPVTANDRLQDQLNILVDSTTAAADDAVKALNILKGNE